MPRIYLTNALNGEEITGTFHEKSCKMQSKQNLELKRWERENTTSGSLSRKVMIMPLIVTEWLRKRLEQKIIQYFLELLEYPYGNLKIHLDQSNHATKPYWNEATDTSWYKKKLTYEKIRCK